ncbi:hypothetical protein HJG60_009503 [Phyllostomus discolor]|uniref:Uncharacterized protein n=1 Tax=Phyllostomus discolor TaxID=89673 RepID=A0A833YG75_9CHIR|nr:hypothetical protein HJG60_009503 [Phyllostomus discolor]
MVFIFSPKRPCIGLQRQTLPGTLQPRGRLFCEPLCRNPGVSFYSSSNGPHSLLPQDLSLCLERATEPLHRHPSASAGPTPPPPAIPASSPGPAPSRHLLPLPSHPTCLLVVCLFFLIYFGGRISLSYYVAQVGVWQPLTRG